jgi:acylphosphatase
MAAVVARHLQIHGRVQGVGFRYSMQREAARLGVSGWVRNRRDGSVEALAQGSDEAVAALVGWARRGPPGAQVTALNVSEGVFSETAASFEQRPTL